MQFIVTCCIVSAIFCDMSHLLIHVPTQSWELAAVEVVKWHLSPNISNVTLLIASEASKPCFNFKAAKNHYLPVHRLLYQALMVSEHKEDDGANPIMHTCS